MKKCQTVLLLLVIAGFALLPVLAKAQSSLIETGAVTGIDTGDRAGTVALTIPATPPDLIYIRPTEGTKLHTYLFDAFGPYPLVGAAFAAGISQAYNSPPEWGQGAAGYGKRLGSDFGVAAVSTTARYALAEAFREDTLYYRCECKGVLQRLRHALISTLTARRGEDGHRVFSVSALVAPYAGSMTAVYAWYPNRYNAKDAFRMGNYTLLGYAGGNIGLEFLYSGPHSLLHRMHLDNGHAAPAPTPSSDSTPTPAPAPAPGPNPGSNP